MSEFDRPHPYVGKEYGGDYVFTDEEVAGNHAEPRETAPPVFVQIVTAPIQEGREGHRVYALDQDGLVWFAEVQRYPGGRVADPVRWQRADWRVLA